MSFQGYTQVYTGNGKGKTTAAMGLALRAAGAGMKVFIAQFIKNPDASENSGFRMLGEAVTIRQYGRGCFIRSRPEASDIDAALAGLVEAESAMTSGKFNVVILDEANCAVSAGLFPAEQLLDIIKKKPASVELVITGRDADNRVIEAADLVTEMKEIKHYYKSGQNARRGIEH